MTVVFMFPGQSSRYPGMLDKLVALSPEPLGRVVASASEQLGRDLTAHFRADNEAAFAKNVDIQVGVFVANHLMLTLLSEAGVRADFSLGLSLGEWNHLVHIGALSFEDALLAVQARGRAYDAGPRGAMASVFPISAEELQEIADKVRDEGGGVVEVVNLNSPRQQVLSGEQAALERALALVEQETYAQATVIEREVPMHCSTFAPVAETFRETLETLPFAEPKIPYSPNRLAELKPSPTHEEYVDLLATHVCRPVLWRASIDALLAAHPEATLVEVGPRRVLYNLLDRKWHKGVSRLHTDSAEDTAAHLRGVIESLRQSQS